MTDDADSPFEFPCEFPIKAMARADVDLHTLVHDIVARHAQIIGALQSRSSSAGKYLAVTITIMATSRAQLDQIYQELSGHPDILMVL